MADGSDLVQITKIEGHMALKPCKECKKEVAVNAPTCPHCGVKNPGVTRKDSLIGLAIVCAVVGGAYVACSDSDADKQAAAAKRAEAEAACMTDLQCLGDKGTIAAGLRCPEHIEKLAKGAVRWTDGTLEPKFSRFRWKDEKAGVITFFGDKAQFQNGFGAYINVIYSCDLAMKQDSKVLSVNAVEGRL